MTTNSGLTTTAAPPSWVVMDKPLDVPTEQDAQAAEADYAGELAYLYCIMEEAEYNKEPVNWRAVDKVGAPRCGGDWTEFHRTSTGGMGQIPDLQ